MKDVEEILKLNKIPLFESVIFFATELNGFNYDYIGELELFYGGGYPVTPKNTTLIFSKGDNYSFSLKLTDDEIECYIDEHGRLYDDDHQIASHYIKKIEDLAMDFKARTDFPGEIEHRHEIEVEFQKTLNNSSYMFLPYCSDKFVKWFKNDSSFLRRRGLTLTIFGS